MKLYVCKRTHDTGENPNVGQCFFFKKKERKILYDFIIFGGKSSNDFSRREPDESGGLLLLKTTKFLLLLFELEPRIKFNNFRQSADLNTSSVFVIDKNTSQATDSR
uniref:SFRICE_025155 n=1 Tax=Spodoptera frugiperda TaxID=7108 RepID=A0A2H1VJT5_SPOFR